MDSKDWSLEFGPSRSSSFVIVTIVKNGRRPMVDSIFQIFKFEVSKYVCVFSFSLMVRFLEKL
jgi:hypothetical protein